MDNRAEELVASVNVRSSFPRVATSERMFFSCSDSDVVFMDVVYALKVAIRMAPTTAKAIMV